VGHPEVANPHDPPSTRAEPTFFGRNDPSFRNPDLQNHVIYGVTTSFSPFAIVLETRRLSVTRVGSNTAVVESTPAGISCGTMCEADFDGGTEVTLAVTNPAGSVFLGWEGACTGTGRCTVDMLFAVRPGGIRHEHVSADVVTTGSRGGSVAGPGLPAVCSAPSACSTDEPSNTIVILTPTPDATSRFAGWVGCTAVSGTSCKVTMSEARTVTAKFEP
jgi:Divergent InlB B-repeat domain